MALDLNKSEDGTITTDYYYADHERRIIFFLDEFESSNLPAWSQVKGVNSLSHLRTLAPFMNLPTNTLTMFLNLEVEFEAQYWFGLSHVGIPHRLLFSIFLTLPLADIIILEVTGYYSGITVYSIQRA